MTKAKRVLVIDDEPQIHRFLKPSLTISGYEVISAMDARQGLRAAAVDGADVIILDLGLPDLDGKDVIARLRATSEVPIIVLSARDRESEKVAALDLGADDYVNKPFTIGELLARLRSVLRRQKPGFATDELSTFEIGTLLIDVAAHEVSSSGIPIKLTPKEFSLLTLLARHAGRVLTHRQILTAIWGPAHQADTQYLRVFIGQLRQKLEADPSEPKLILTESGIGYRFAIDP